MGIAAYNRGTKLVSQQIDANLPEHNSIVVKALNKLPRGTGRIFQRTVIRRCGSSWYIMNGKEGGFARFSYEYKSLRALFAVWSCYIVGYGRDKHSFFYEVE